jgi:GTPase
MKFRVKEGSGEAYYRIGVEDNGRPTGLSRDDMCDSLKTVCYLASKIHTDVIVLRVS